MSLIKSMVFPGYSGYSSWNTSWAESQCAAIAALGFNTIQLQQSYSMSYTSSTTMSPYMASATWPTVSAFSQAVQAMALAAQAAGLAVSLKPMCTPNLGPTGQPNSVANANCAQWAICPGAISSSLAPTYGTGAAQISDSGWYTGDGAGTGAVITWGSGGAPNPVGGRLVLTNQSNAWNIPGGRPLDAYGKTPPTWNTVTSVVNGTTLGIANTPVTSQSGATVPNYAYILNDTAAATWFANWLAQLQNFLNICIAVGVTPASLNIGTELDLLTLYYESNWRSLIATLRSQYPTTKLYVNHSNTFAQAGQSSVTYGVPFYDALDYIAPSCYPTVGTAGGGDGVSTMVNGWLARVWGTWLGKYNGTSQPTVSLAGLSAANGGVPILMGEVGALSKVGAGYQPTTGTSFNATVTLTNGNVTLPIGTSSGVAAGYWVVPYEAGTGTFAAPVQVQASGLTSSSCTVSAAPTAGGTAYLNFTSTQPSQTDQATYVDAAMQAAALQTGVPYAGFNWWTWYFATNLVSYENAQSDFAPKPAAQAVFSSTFSQAPRTTDSAPNHYRLTH